MRNDLTIEYLQTILHYNPRTNKWTWLKSAKGVKVGDVAGHLDKSGYVVIKINQQKYLAHRLAWFYMIGKWPEDEIDQKNRQRSDNRWCNLREATHCENLWNTTKRKNNSSGYKGVSWDTSSQRWRAQLQANGHHVYLGVYITKEEAALAHNEAAIQYHGEFAYLNEITWPNGVVQTMTNCEGFESINLIGGEVDG